MRYLEGNSKDSPDYPITLGVISALPETYTNDFINDDDRITDFEIISVVMTISYDEKFGGYKVPLKIDKKLIRFGAPRNN